MSANPIPALVTVEEFGKLPGRPDGHYELHHGEVVFVTPPEQPHKRLQRRLYKLLEDKADAHGFITETEFAYRPLPESEVWVADVVCISAPREKAIVRWLQGSPELVIEVKSPGNTKHELRDKAMTTLAGEGGAEFWVVDEPALSVTVYTKASGVHVYGPGLAVPVTLFESRIQVSAIFSVRP